MSETKCDSRHFQIFKVGDLVCIRPELGSGFILPERKYAAEGRKAEVVKIGSLTSNHPWALVRWQTKRPVPFPRTSTIDFSELIIAP